MGYQADTYALISMTNKDVYYIDELTARRFMELLELGKTGFVTFTETRSSADITVNTANLSSIVVKDKQNG